MPRSGGDAVNYGDMNLALDGGGHTGKPRASQYYAANARQRASLLACFSEELQRIFVIGSELSTAGRHSMNAP